METQILRELGWRGVQAGALLPGGHGPPYPTEEGIGHFLSTSLFGYSGKGQDKKHASDFNKTQLVDRKILFVRLEEKT